MGKIRIGIIGAGLRGTYEYASYLSEHMDNCEIVSVVEKRKGRREVFKQKYNIKEEYVFENIEEFLKQDKIVDGVIITSGDDRHYEHAKALLEKGYNILLETPITNTLDRLVHLNDICEEYKDKVFMASNLLRYNSVLAKLKEIIDSKELGELINIQYSNKIGYWKFAHDYVRGNWRNSSDTSPLILNKGCSDIDVLLHLIGSKCKKVASFGDLKHITNEKFKLNMSESCMGCSIEIECPYSAKKIYLQDNKKENYAVHIDPTEENLLNILAEGPYGRCIYRCDNNVVDHMINILEFENGVKATLNLYAFAKESEICINLMFSHGEVVASLLKEEIIIRKFIDEKDNIVNLKSDNKEKEEHKIIKDFIKLISEKDFTENKSTSKSTIESHYIAFALEYSRVSEEVVYVDDFFETAINMTREIELALL
ncbi:Gfo/Idh/MocA family protein [Romboutsia sp.]|uniref:Gfo/Idh/MocA family protein n=1 Tax=Romboutsia sp. TaxID=1965302 RepID=UPI003F3F0131